MGIDAARGMGRAEVNRLVPDRRNFLAELKYHGPAPIGERASWPEYRKDVIEPLHRAMPGAGKIPLLFLTDIHEGSVWTAAVGRIEGEMRRPWLGIPPGPGIRQLRFGEFCRFGHDRIAEIRCLYDIPGLAAQAGIELLPDFGGRQLNEHAWNGRNASATSEAEGSDTGLTRRLVAEMIGGCNRLEGSDLHSQGMENHWHPDMEWHGPWGIGSARGLNQFHRIAQGPSVRSFPGQRGVWPKTAFLAQGRVAAFTGWPSLVGEFTGEPFRGIPPTNGPVEQTIMDFHIRRGGRLAVNWVLMDLIKFAADCGIDLMAKLRHPSGGS